MASVAIFRRKPAASVDEPPDGLSMTIADVFWIGRRRTLSLTGPGARRPPSPPGRC